MQATSTPPAKSPKTTAFVDNVNELPRNSHTHSIDDDKENITAKGDRNNKSVSSPRGVVEFPDHDNDDDDDNDIIAEVRSSESDVNKDVLVEENNGDEAKDFSQSRSDTGHRYQDLEGEEPDIDTLKACIRKGTNKLDFFPTFCGSAFQASETST